jgi:hypothetical protein
MAFFFFHCEVNWPFIYVRAQAYTTREQHTLDRTVQCLKRRGQATCDAVVSEKLPSMRGVHRAPSESFHMSSVCPHSSVYENIRRLRHVVGSSRTFRTTASPLQAVPCVVLVLRLYDCATLKIGAACVSEVELVPVCTTSHHRKYCSNIYSVNRR